MPTILLTNDDGVHAAGLLALHGVFSQLADVVVLAPERNWSATSHAKTMHKPLRVHAARLADGTPAHACSGSPTDCVALAAAGVLGVKPDLVVSGVNNGHNMGNDVTYSGTVACAMEATIWQIPGIAVSAPFPAWCKADVEEVRMLAARYAGQIAQKVLTEGLPAGTLLNINVPGVATDEVRGVEITRLGRRDYKDELIKREDPYGQPYYWLGGPPIDFPDDGTDVGAVANHYVSVTPIKLDMTDRDFLSVLRDWRL